MKGRAGAFFGTFFFNQMSNAIIVGAQWGDEGKGKIVDFLTEDTDVVVRAQGGSNAGHTVINNGSKYVLHMVPSGILWPEKTCVIGNGVALDPMGLVEEIETLEAQGIPIKPEQLLISDRAHLTLPSHRLVDGLRESQLGSQKIGTTGRGIGPTYADKAHRVGLRMHDILDMANFAERLRAKIVDANKLAAAAGVDPIDVEETVAKVIAAVERLRPHVTNTMAVLHAALKSGKSLLFEGAQGTYLDVDYGTYPFVTSSNTTSAGACTGSGFPPHRIDKVIGVCKAYTTRVGAGPFPTEDEPLGDHFHGMGREFGATTGRERRCGWLDTVLLRQATMVSGFDELAMTNLDGLDEMDTIQVCTAYKLNGSTVDLPPAGIAEFEAAEPVYEELPGWKTDISGIREYEDLPEAAKSYLDRIQQLLETPISMIGVGPDRAQTIVR
ncbi:MAG: adenylosuccinate synthase [Verrucomicrobiales bacterium]